MKTGVRCPRCREFGTLQPVPEHLPKNYSATVLHETPGGRRVCKVKRLADLDALLGPESGE